MLVLQLLPRLTSWSANERLASLRSLAALLPISGFQLLRELPHVLLQLYGTCVAAEGKHSLGQQGRQQQQEQCSPLLLLVQHAVLRELRNRDSDVSSGNHTTGEWHRGGLQELGACSSLCCSLEAVELVLQCTGKVALLVPPCCWLPIIATHLGLQQEVQMYISRKQDALTAATVDIVADQQAIRPLDEIQAEKEFLRRFDGGYKYLVDTVLHSEKRLRGKQNLEEPAASGTSSVCSFEARKQALLLLARLLRGLKPHYMQQNQPQQNHQGDATSAFCGVYGLCKEEVWLLVRVIEHVQGTKSGKAPNRAPGTTAVDDDSDKVMPFLAAPLLQLLRAAGSLCQLEARNLFAAALLQQIDPRSNQELAKAVVWRFSHSRIFFQGHNSISIKVAIKLRF